MNHKNILTKHNVSVVFSMVNKQMPKNDDIIYYTKFALADTEDADIAIYFDATNKLIHQHLSDGENVLIHCNAGVSRSTTITAAYLCFVLEVTPTEAVQIIRKTRAIVF